MTIVRRLTATRQPDVHPTAYGKRTLEDCKIYYEYFDGFGNGHAVTVTTVNDRLIELYSIRDSLEIIRDSRRKELADIEKHIADIGYMPTATARDRLLKLTATNYFFGKYNDKTEEVRTVSRQITTVNNQIKTLLSGNFETIGR